MSLLPSLSESVHMGASIAHGKGLYRKKETLENGTEFVEIEPVEGGYASASYSSVKELVEYAHSKGVDPAVWPIYYDTPLSEVDIEDIYRRCERLRDALASLSREDRSGNRWLQRVAD